eukprot:53884-Prorocentrum_minimum.AAC.1
MAASRGLEWTVWGLGWTVWGLEWTAWGVGVSDVGVAVDGMGDGVDGMGVGVSGVGVGVWTGSVTQHRKVSLDYIKVVDALGGGLDFGPLGDDACWGEARGIGD